MIWIDIPGHPGYKANIAGEVLSLKGGDPKVLTPKVDSKTGYLRIELSQDGKPIYAAVHQLIALAFLGPPPPGLQVCHNDSNKTNNRIGNLRYDTPQSNTQDSVVRGTHYSVQMAQRDACENGHEFTPENTGWRWGHGGKASGVKNRRCKECHRQAIARYRAKKKVSQSTGDRGEDGLD